MSLLKQIWRENNDPFGYDSEYANNTFLKDYYKNVNIKDYIRYDTECLLFAQLLDIAIATSQSTLLDFSDSKYTIFVPLNKAIYDHVTIRNIYNVVFNYYARPEERIEKYTELAAIVKQHVVEGTVNVPTGITELAKLDLNDGTLYLVNSVVS